MRLEAPDTPQVAPDLPVDASIVMTTTCFSIVWSVPLSATTARAMSFSFMPQTVMESMGGLRAWFVLSVLTSKMGRLFFFDRVTFQFKFL